MIVASSDSMFFSEFGHEYSKSLAERIFKITFNGIDRLDDEIQTILK